MKIELTDKELFDIEWSILVAISTVEQQNKKEKKFSNSPLVIKLLKLHDLIAEKRKKEKINNSWKEVLKNVR